MLLTVCFGKCAEQMRQILNMSPENRSTSLHPKEKKKKPKNQRQYANPLNGP